MRGLYTVSVADKTIEISETALEASKAGRIMLWAYGELPIRSVFIMSPNSAEALHIMGRAPSPSPEDDVYVISADGKRITVPVGAVNATCVGRILSRQFECPGLYWRELWLVCMSLVEEAFHKRVCSMARGRSVA
jgi:hypothetical protein